MNAFVTILIYIIDPWFIERSIKQTREMKKNISVMT